MSPGRWAAAAIVALVAGSAVPAALGQTPPEAPAVPPVAPVAPATRAEPAMKGLIEAPIDLPGRLAAGSQAGAGLDPASTSEIAHPSNPAALVASLRKLGGVLDGDQASAVVQMNPYLLLGAEDDLYDEIVAGRRHFLERLLQDSSLTLVASRVATAAAPVPGGAADASEGTAPTRPLFGVGLSLELLGERSIYGPTYAGCITSRTSAAAAERLGQMLSKPVQPRAFIRRAQESDQQYRQRLENDPKVTAYRKSLQVIVDAVADQVRDCYGSTARATDALFLAAGGRWLLGDGGLTAQEAVRDRSYASLAYERFTGPGLELTVQLRALEERLRLTGERLALTDLGLSIRWSSDRAALGVEATRSVAGDDRLATCAGSLQLAVGHDWAVDFGLRGQADTLEDAVERATIAVSISYQKTPGRRLDLTGFLPSLFPASLP